MPQFEVPQFVDVESKIVGPLTLKQFGFVAVPALISFFLFFVLGTFIWIVVSAILLSAGLSFAFIKISGRHLYEITFYAFKFLWQPKLFLWKRPLVRQVINIKGADQDIALLAKRRALKVASEGFSKVSRLWQDMTTSRNPIPKREKSLPKQSIGEIKERYEVFKRTTGEKDVARRVDYR